MKIVFIQTKRKGTEVKAWECGEGIFSVVIFLFYYILLLVHNPRVQACIMSYFGQSTNSIRRLTLFLLLVWQSYVVTVPVSF